MTPQRRSRELVELITHEDWSYITGMDPDFLVWSLSFEDCLRLAYVLLSFQDLEEGPYYSVRVLYALKRYAPVLWNSSWRHDALLGEVCFWATYMPSERYYALDAARQKVNPLPAALAIKLASCHHMPGEPLVSAAQSLQLQEYALKEYPFINALLAKQRCYRETNQLQLVEALDAEIKNRSRAIRNGEITEPSVLPDCVLTPFSFDSPCTGVNVSFRTVSPQVLRNWVKARTYHLLYAVDPRWIIQTLKFKDSVRLCYQLMLHDAAAQSYAIRLLYALRVFRYDEWVQDWLYDGFLGHLCELSHRYDDALSAYCQAKYRFAEPSPHLKVLLARQRLAPDPCMSMEMALRYVREALEEKPYVDVLVLYKELLLRNGQNDKVAKVEQQIVELGEEGEWLPLPIPACVHEHYEDI